MLKGDIGAVSGIREPRMLAVRGPASTTGGKSGHDEHHIGLRPDGGHRTMIHWWAWRTQEAPAIVKAALASAFSGAVGALLVRPRKKGHQGYGESEELILDDAKIGLIAWGGSTQRGWTFVEITGRGCELVRDWTELQSGIRALAGYEIRRLDIAFDTFDDNHGFPQTLAAYDAKRFTRRGRRPKRMFTTWDSPHDGREIRIGHRGSDQFFRGYEKGKQVLGLAATSRYLADPKAATFVTLALEHGLTTQDGEAAPELFERWWRHEIELRPKKRRIPPDSIDHRDQIFAGAYPYLQQLLETVSPIVLPARTSKTARADLAHLLDHVNRQFGRKLRAACANSGGDFQAVWALISEDRSPIQQKRVRRGT